jgi:hypothetical protein
MTMNISKKKLETQSPSKDCINRAAGVYPIVVLTGHLKEAEARALGVSSIVPTVASVEEAIADISKPEGQRELTKESRKT